VAETVDDDLIRTALAAARDTRALHVARGARHRVAEQFERQFGSTPAVVVTDSRTFAVAGRDVVDALRKTGHDCGEPMVLADPALYAEYRFLEEVQTALAGRRGIPVAVGSGTINDLTKLAAHRLGRPYMAVATAASMDGYTAFGASITHLGRKQTFACPAPAVVVADLDVIAAAPRELNAAGYADLLAKVPAGADWLLADAAGVEPVDAHAWQTVQGQLRNAVADPAGVRRGDMGAIRRLTVGLMMGGFAMQATQSSRPASGAEHQFSHLWDMQHHTHDGAAPAHGFKVGIGTLASVALYEQLLDHDPTALDIDGLVREWPPEDVYVSRPAASLGDLAPLAAEELRAKYPSPDVLREQLTRLRDRWPALRIRLREHLLPFADIRDRLRAAGAPDEPEQLGIGRDRLRASYSLAHAIRRRFTVLDVATRGGLFDRCLARIFGPGGPWPK
jgi:glycerol-1-phosphate dehydrogenase [NAD(P)+]